MNFLPAFLVVLSIVTGSMAIWEFVKNRTGGRNFAVILATVITVMLIVSAIFSSVLAPSGNSGSSSSGTSSASTVNDTQVGDTSNPTPTPLPTDTPTPSPPSPGTQLFPANGANWLQGWTGGSDWYTSGNMMLNNGQQINSISLAPYHPGDNGISNYAVDVQIELNRWSDDMGLNNFGIIVRSPDGQKGYTFAVCVSALTLNNCGTNDKEIYISNGAQNIAENTYLPPAGTWFDYRMEVQGNSVKVFINGTEYLKAPDNTYNSGGEVGLWSDRSQISIRSFTVTAL
jgi:hypothetical protein